jgi:tRNA G10  N-methylase Trm11
MPSVLQSSSSAAVSRGDSNRLEVSDRAAHDWYRFVLSFPPHLVRDYINRFELGTDACVLDPFCGTGTTMVECKKLRIVSVGVEAHPMSTSRRQPHIELAALEFHNYALSFI